MELRWRGSVVGIPGSSVDLLLHMSEVSEIASVLSTATEEQTGH